MWSLARRWWRWVRVRYLLVGYQDPAATVPVMRHAIRESLYWRRSWTEVTDE